MGDEYEQLGPLGDAQPPGIGPPRAVPLHPAPRSPLPPPSQQSEAQPRSKTPPPGVVQNPPRKQVQKMSEKSQSPLVFHSAPILIGIVVAVISTVVVLHLSNVFNGFDSSIVYCEAI